MKRFIEGESRQQVTLMPDVLDDYVGEDNPVRVIDLYVDELDLVELGFADAVPATTGRPGYHPSVLLKIYIYGYLNRIQSSRRLERETRAALDEASIPYLTFLRAGRAKPCREFRPSTGQMPYPAEVHGIRK